MDRRDAFIDALATVADAASATGVRWLVGGSAGLQLRGLQLDQPPRDLDIYADDGDAVKLDSALRRYASDMQQESFSPIYRSLLSHYNIEGVQVELVGGFIISSGDDRYEVEVSEVLAPLELEAVCNERKIGIVPLAHEMWFNYLRRRQDRVALIAETVRAEKERHLEGFQVIEGRNRLSKASVKQVHELIDARETRELE
ncbi:hypothetical protein PAECIP111893_04696 [Paenibacillus plantiphilus]|uniref:Nucleotidyl transferase AbiEii toxin, Type IV TA system n=1 Tax=Paenibacillus plantiphilus TaxID=2905650 RepID=A0ABN8H288_9BACL|nr:hypothetical protein [Paenibacillus plantiphilus]CAH1221286.1 hypothetical protein PAECIP111893_04696 [Paenibacillus plantiphilus]